MTEYLDRRMKGKGERKKRKKKKEKKRKKKKKIQKKYEKIRTVNKTICIHRFRKLSYVKAINHT